MNPSNSAEKPSTIRSRFVREYVVRNSFRILGLPSNATKADVNAAISMVKRKAKLGVPVKTTWDMEWLGDLQRSESEIQYSLSRLSNPEDRIVERFFWPAVGHVSIPVECKGHIFLKTGENLEGDATAHPLGYEYQMGGIELIDSKNVSAVSFQKDLFGRNEIPSALDQFHDFLLYRIIGFALNHPTFGDWKFGNQFPETSPDAGWEPTEALRTYTRQVIKILSAQEYWDDLLESDNEKGFEPRSTIEDVTKAKSRILHLLIVDMLESNFYEHVYNPEDLFENLFVELSDRPEGNESNVKEDILSQLIAFFKERISREINEISDNILNKVVREGDKGDVNKPICEQALLYFDKNIQPLLRFLPLEEEGGYELRVESADILFAIGNAFTWADEFDKTVAILERAVKLSEDTHLESKIEEKLIEIRQTTEKMKVFAELSPINESPYLDLHERFYGRSDPQPLTLPDGTVVETYVTTHYACFFGIPLFPKKRYRVVDGGGGRYRVLGSLPYSDGNRAHIAGLVLAVVIFIIYLWGNSSGGSREVAPPPPPSYPSYDFSGINSSPLPSPSGSEKSSGPTSASTETGYKSRSVLDGLRNDIETDKANLRRMESELQSLEDQINSLKQEIEGSKLHLDLLEANEDYDQYNILVHEHNAKITKGQRLVSEYNELYREYGVKFAAVKEMINDYNLRVSNGRR